MNENKLKKGCPTHGDTIYKQKIRLSCPFCGRYSRRKVFKSAWQLKCHFSYVHQNNADCEKVISELEDLLSQGVLVT